jgi:hypothetical protein
MFVWLVIGAWSLGFFRSVDPHNRYVLNVALVS